MTKRNLTLSPLAGTAIAAVLALSTTPVAAQDTAVPDPVAAAPAAPPAAAPPPVETAPVVTSQPIVQAVPDTPEPAVSASAAPVAAAPARRAATPTRALSPRAGTASATAPAASAAMTVPSAQAPAEVTPTLLPEAAPAPVAASPAPIVDTRADGTGYGEELGLGLLGLAVVGGAFAFTRRGKSAPAAVTRVSTEPTYRPVARAPAAFTPQPGPGFDRPAPFAAVAERSQPGSAVKIPDGPLPTGPAMADLYHRMVTAAPDASNPFTSVKRRGKRARWLLKQHEYALNRQAAGSFDFRAYEPSGATRQQQSGNPTLQHA